MNIAEVLTLDRTCCNAPAVSKKGVLGFISTLLADHSESIDADEVYQELWARERLGSTGIGEGIAIPHCRLSSCSEITGVLLKLGKPIDFDASDDAQVDLVFALIVPDEQNDEHLQVLASIAELMQSSGAREKLRDCESHDKLYQIAIAET